MADNKSTERPKHRYQWQRVHNLVTSGANYVLSNEKDVMVVCRVSSDELADRKEHGGGQNLKWWLFGTTVMNLDGLEPGDILQGRFYADYYTANEAKIAGEASLGLA